ncbi:hypothetical protein B0181_02150 [Moraxella caviae]|uniref:2-keto-4-pentenoate hydratase/2-oxohepta-3-ene-1,7-dioic acid hydratase (Catechol pathway) n=1 Tax=Moraxella caviae TaxID=34060 RepID=A0A1T0A8M8_9GAMM|nr:fumarylacetoacetate hydrolase family protein [Moraxella caviae]OOR92102.1 hypothetical protein B0181_02150 [Moraxella caviae]STZ14459.1 2-keto-4-pentenoate hydratase/2-oxohepta-3-ene-1,7-dioic acid hydratase (catechol pathway) [Moraxella caviae]
MTRPSVTFYPADNHADSSAAQNIAVNTIYCLGRSYAEHISELGNATPDEPLIFLKPNSSLSTSNTLTLPEFSQDVHHETELVLLMGENRQILGVSVGLDLTARDVQSVIKAKGLPWLKAKGFKQACWVGDFKPYKPAEFELFLSVNGEVRQHDTTAKLMYSLDEIVAYLDELYGVQAGDLIMTGTPKGVGKLERGDRLVVKLGDDSYNINIV